MDSYHRDSYLNNSNCGGEQGEFWDRESRSQNILIPVQLEHNSQEFGYYYLDNYQFPYDGQKNLDAIIGIPLKVEIAGLNVYVGPILPKLQENYINSLFTLAESIDRCDMSGHSQETSIWAQRLAQKMNYSGVDMLKMGLVGKLHDIGKSVVSKDLLTKPGPLSETEWSIMKHHPIYGAALMDPAHALESIKSIVRWHHERYDGLGYPDGVKGKEIPEGSRLLAVVDAFSTMVSGRAYRKPVSYEVALKELIKYKGTQFDPNIVDQMVELVTLAPRKM